MDQETRLALQDIRNQGKNNILPGLFRYQPKQLVPYFGYDNLVRYQADVEIATLFVLADIGLIPANDFGLITPEVEQRVTSIWTREVDYIERNVTGHDVRSLVLLIIEAMPQPLRRWVHDFLTSYDVIDTARALQFLRAHLEVLVPNLKTIISQFRKLTLKYAETLQIGRTHGQHAVPITVGFWLASILHRILYNMVEMNEKANALVGKISGAVGASNAIHGLRVAALCGDYSFEKRVLDRLGVKTSPITTQIVPPEPLGYYLHACTRMSAVFGQFGRDGRNLMRSEILEISEPRKKGQVGSSTMAHKRNPISFENLEGTWYKTKAAFGLALDTASICEHQRDLVASSPAREYPVIIVHSMQQVNTLLRKDKKTGKTFLQRLKINPEMCRRNFEMNAKFIPAEPLYIALQMAGYEGNAHALVNEQAMELAKSTNMPLVDAIDEIAARDTEVAKAFGNIPTDHMHLLRHPETYTGNAAEKAKLIATLAERFLVG